MALGLAFVQSAVELTIADLFALEQRTRTALLRLRHSAAAAGLGDHRQTGRTRSWMTKQCTLVHTIGVSA